MSNERIDLHDDSLLKQIREHEEKYHNPTNGEIDTILHCAKGIGLIAELERCYERIDNAESALREIWDHQINNVGGYNVTEILQYYKNAYGLNIEPEEQ